MKIVECVPNFSEGRNRKVIDEIAAAIEGIDGALLLDVDPGADANRTVVTFAGSPEAVEEAAFQAIAKAAELIDMRTQKGEHPRMGATDVFPFIPVSGMTMAECVELARRVGERVARELGIPIYLYEEAATRPERRLLADVRKGEYEGLAEKLRDPAWAPDFGEPAFNERSGATVMGARKFLIAYNVNLNTRDTRLANRIAFALREMGRAKRDEQGKIVRNPDGTSVKIPGRFKKVRAIGWYMDDYNMAQVSMNLTDYDVSPLHLVFEAACEEAEKIGVRVTGSELVGLVPLEVMTRAGAYFREKQGRSPAAPERELVRMAVQTLGLGELRPFTTDEKIIEYRLGGPSRPLVRDTLSGLLDKFSEDTPAPGGGSAAALCGSLSAALAAMVASLSAAKGKDETVRGEMKAVALRAQALKARLLDAVDDDTAAFADLMAAFRLKLPSEEKAGAVRAATLEASRVPLGVMAAAREALELARETARSGLASAVTDAGVAALAGRAAVEGAWYNVKVNLVDLEGDEEAGKILSAAKKLLESARTTADEVAERVEEKLGS